VKRQDEERRKREAERKKQEELDRLRKIEEEKKKKEEEEENKRKEEEEAKRKQLLVRKRMRERKIFKFRLREKNLEKQKYKPGMGVIDLFFIFDVILLDAGFFKSLTSNLKKNSAFINRLKNGVSRENKASIITGLKSLSLTRYVSEAAQALASSTVKIADMDAALEVIPFSLKILCIHYHVFKRFVLFFISITMIFKRRCIIFFQKSLLRIKMKAWRRDVLFFVCLVKCMRLGLLKNQNLFLRLSRR